MMAHKRVTVMGRVMDHLTVSGMGNPKVKQKEAWMASRTDQWMENLKGLRRELMMANPRAFQMVAGWGLCWGLQKEHLKGWPMDILMVNQMGQQKAYRKDEQMELWWGSSKERLMVEVRGHQRGTWMGIVMENLTVSRKENQRVTQMVLGMAH